MNKCKKTHKTQDYLENAYISVYISVQGQQIISEVSFINNEKTLSFYNFLFALHQYSKFVLEVVRQHNKITIC